MLLTRSPLHVRPRAVSSFDLHVLGTPPAFILSQDQTLRLRGGNRFPLKSDLGFGPRPPPVLRVRARAGFPFARIVCLAFLFFAVQYPVFKVLRRPSRGPVAFGSTRIARRYITRPLPRRQELFPRFSDFFSRRLPAPGGRGAPPPPSPSPAEKAARACYPLPAPGARGHFRKARKSSPRTARGERACGARRAHPRAGGTLQKACGRRLADDAATVLFWAGTIALIPSYTAKRDDRWSPRLPNYG